MRFERVFGPMPLVIVESPFAGETPAELSRNKRYACAAMRDCLARGEAPYASHLLMPQCLDDTSAEERELGMRVGFEWGRKADLVAVYEDLGVSPGMALGIEIATSRGVKIERRKLWEAR